MSSLLSLWLPIVLTAVAVFVASSIIWMALPIHKHDYTDPGEKEGPLMDVLRREKFAPGVYYVPWCQGAKAKDPKVQEALKTGPWAMLYVNSSAPNMGKLLGAWMVHLLIISVFVAYLLSATLAPGAAFLAVFRVAGAAALLAHAGYAMPMCIWHGQPWKQLPGRLFDGVVYALITAAIFAWLWPSGAAVAG